MTWRVVGSGVAVLFAGLLGLDKVVPILTTHSVGFGWSSKMSTLSLKTDDGNLPCWIRLKVRVVGETMPSFSVAFASGAPLAAYWTQAPEGGPFWIGEIVKQGARAGSCSQLSWPAGDELRVSVVTPSKATLALDDWEVYPDKGEADSKSNDLKRTIWHWASVPLLVIATVLAAIEAARPKESEAELTASTLFAGLAAGVKGETKQATKRMQKTLRMVYLDGIGLSGAFAETKITSREWRSAGVQFRPKLARLVDATKSLTRSFT